MIEVLLKFIELILYVFLGSIAILAIPMWIAQYIGVWAILVDFVVVFGFFMLPIIFCQTYDR